MLSMILQACAEARVEYPTLVDEARSMPRRWSYMAHIDVLELIEGLL
jgi:hypothetical protein